MEVHCGARVRRQELEKTSAHQQAWSERLLAELDLKGSERVLDLGCGDGRVTVQLETLVPDGEVVGVARSLRSVCGLPSAVVHAVDRYFPDTATLLRWVDQPCLVPFLPHIAGADREAFRSCVHARMIEETLPPGGTCFETFRRVNVFARS